MADEAEIQALPTVTAKDLLTMGTNDVLAYRAVPPRLREILSIMNPADAIAAFGLT